MEGKEKDEIKEIQKNDSKSEKIDENENLSQNSDTSSFTNSDEEESNNKNDSENENRGSLIVKNLHEQFSDYESKKQNILDEETVADINKNIIEQNNRLDENKKDINSNDKKGNEKEISINPDDYVQLMKIGEGNFSEVYLVENKETKVLYALKQFVKRRVEQLKKQEDVLMEKYVMNKISPFKYLIGYGGSYKDQEFLYVLYEYINGGEIWRKSTNYGLFSTDLIRYYFKQILLGINHMHSFEIIHRDIKPENIMLTKDQRKIKIIDFGSSKDLKGTEFGRKLDEQRKKMHSRKPLYKDFVGTPNYMAPECCRNKGSDEKSDIWSLACLLYQLFTGFPPFLGKSEYLIFIKSTEAKYIFPRNIIDPSAEDLIKKILLVDPKKRPTVEEILEHDFLKVNDEKYPIPKLSEFAFLTIRDSLRNNYLKFRDISYEFKTLKEKERMEEDAIRNGIEREEECKYTQKEKDKKDELDVEIKKAKTEIENKLEQIKDIIFKCELNDQLKEANIDKFTYLEKQINHELFDEDIETYYDQLLNSE